MTLEKKKVSPEHLILGTPELNKERDRLIQEANELMLIFGSIVRKLE